MVEITRPELQSHMCNLQAGGGCAFVSLQISNFLKVRDSDKANDPKPDPILQRNINNIQFMMAIGFRDFRPRYMLEPDRKGNPREGKVGTISRAPSPSACPSPVRCG